MRWKLLIVLLMINVPLALATDPAIFFSDLTDGVISGGHWGGAQEGKGAAVSIWGRNFSSLRGSSTLTVCGVVLNEDSDFAEWGIVNTPGQDEDPAHVYSSAIGLERITFWLKNGMQTGASTIKITTSDGESNTIPFYCRDNGTIYFISTSGDDTNDGEYSTDQGNNNGPWQTPGRIKAYSDAGDAIYIREGNYTQGDAYDSYSSTAMIDFWSNNHNNGYENNSISFRSYPGEIAQLGEIGTSISTCIWHHGSTPDILNYWTFSLLNMRTDGGIVNWGGVTAGSAMGTSDNIRFIANDCSTIAGAKTIIPWVGGGVQLDGDGNYTQGFGQTNLFMLGNHLHDAGVDNRNDPPPTTRGYGFSLSGYGGHQNIYIGWNEVSHNQYGHAYYIFGHTVFDQVENLSIHDNWIHHNSMRGGIIGGSEGRWEADYGGVRDTPFLLGEVKFYNNIMSNNGGSGLLICGETGNNEVLGDGGFFRIYNNIFSNNSGYGINIDNGCNVYGDVEFKNNIILDGEHYFVDGAPNVSTGSNNIFYGLAESLPAWLSNSNESNPMFISSTPFTWDEFQLQAGSPGIDEGTSSVSTIVSTDVMGSTRPQGTGYDIGIFEYVSGFHAADLDEDGNISTNEIRTYVSRWRAGEVLLSLTNEAISIWKN